MNKRKPSAAAVLLLMAFFAGGILRPAPIAMAETLPDYAAIWAEQKRSMKWAPYSTSEMTSWDGTIASSINKDGTGTIWYVNNVSELAHALKYGGQNDTLSIQKDLDCNGFRADSNGNVTKIQPWEPYDFGGGKLRILGNGYTIYNLWVPNKDDHNSSFVENIGDGSSIEDLHFKNVILEASGFVDRKYTNLNVRNYARAATLFGDIFRSGIRFDNVSMENALVSAEAYWAFAFMMFSKEQALTNDNFGGVTINNCYTKNVVCYAPGVPTNTDHYLPDIACASAFVGGGLGATDANHGVTITNCYSVDSMVISGSGHSGGFSSCTSGKFTVKNCFSDVVVYGTKSTGAFHGVMHQGTYLFENCFALGSVEGQEYIGGFAASYERGKHESEYKESCSVRFQNCYSGAITGMLRGGQHMGSFLGAMSVFRSNLGNPNVLSADEYTFNNCYAMGETGNIELNMAYNYQFGTGTVGGFIGSDDVYGGTPPMVKYTNVYYDKQTTGMREWAIGRSKELYGKNGGESTFVKGVLTTNTAKAGRGLTGISQIGKPGEFQDFSDPVWRYEEGRYPELLVFRNAAVWDKTTKTGFRDPKLVKAYSAASVAAVRLDPWEELNDANAFPYNQAYVYDTVRDLTVGFELSSGVDWRQIPNPHRIGNADNPAKPTVSLYNEGNGEKVTLPVITLETGENGKSYAKNPAPGIQWLSANATVGDRVGQRRLRVIPTANLYTGESTIVLAGKTTGAPGDPYGQFTEVYDHADDVYMAYSTGLRMSYNLSDITVGIYPDQELKDSQKAVQKTNEDNPARFSQLWDRFQGVATNHLTNGSKISVDGMRLAYFNGTQIVDNVVSDTSIKGGGFGAVDNLGLDNTGDAKRWNRLFNGNTAFTRDDQGAYTLMDELGLYALRYRWTFLDGRYLEGGKIVSVIKGLSDVRIDVEDMKGNPVETDVTPGIRTGGGDPDLTGPARKEAVEAKIPYGTKTTAGWKHRINPEDIKEVNVQIGRDTFTNVKPNDANPMRVSRIYYKDFYVERDRLKISKVTVQKEYRLEPGGDAAYLRFQKEPTDSVVPEFHFRDLEEDVSILLKVNPRILKLHLRQIVLAPFKVTIPEYVFAKVNRLQSKGDTAVDYAQSLNVMGYSKREDAAPPVGYESYTLPAGDFFRLEALIPQYYRFIRYDYRLAQTQAPTKAEDKNLVLDYTQRGVTDYWVTVYLQSQSPPSTHNTIQVKPNEFAAFTPAPANTPGP